MLGLWLLMFLAGCRSVDDWVKIRQEHAVTELDALLNPTLQLDGPLTPSDAMRHALAHNLDYRLLLLEKDIREEAASGARLRLLPDLIVSAEANYRSRVRAVRSKILDVDSGGTFPAHSYSSPKDNRAFDVQLAWNLVDFGISYFRARQAGNQARIIGQRTRRAAQNLALDVTLAYYRAVAADKAADQARSILGRIQKHQRVIRGQIDGKVLGEIKGLDSEEALVIMRMKLQDFETEHQSAMAELASLIGLAPGAQIAFAHVDFEKLPEQIGLDVQALEREALESRPELFEQDLQERISVDEVNASIVDLFPSPMAWLGHQRDSNRYLKYHSWQAAGLRASWNLLALPRKLSRVREAKLSVKLVKDRRLALACGVLAQTHLAVIACEDDRRQFELARDLSTIRQRKLSAGLKHLEQGQIDAGEVMRMEAEALFARIRSMLAHAELATSVRRLANAVGRGLDVGEATPAAQPGGMVGDAQSVSRLVTNARSETAGPHESEHSANQAKGELNAPEPAQSDDDQDSVPDAVPPPSDERKGRWNPLAFLRRPKPQSAEPEPVESAEDRDGVSDDETPPSDERKGRSNPCASLRRPKPQSAEPESAESTEDRDGVSDDETPSSDERKGRWNPFAFLRRPKPQSAESEPVESPEDGESVFEAAPPLSDERKSRWNPFAFLRRPSPETVELVPLSKP